MHEEPSFTARYPAEQPVLLRATMRDGTVHEGACTVTKGEPTRPHASAELAAKFRELGEPIWGASATRTLLEGLASAESIDDFRSFMKGLAL